MSRVKARVKGVVQGVGFRYFVMRNANKLGIKGYVRNCPDGDVELEAEGEKAELEKLIDKVKQGPSLSRVQKVSTDWSEEEKGYRSFNLKW